MIISVWLVKVITLGRILQKPFLIDAHSHIKGYNVSIAFKVYCNLKTDQISSDCSFIR